MAPSHDAFHLPALSASVAEARRRVLSQLREWGIAEEVRDDAGLVVSELFTNALRHTDSEKIGCELRFNGDLLRVEVADQGCGTLEPREQVSDADQEGGRGLLLVGALSDTWGVRPDKSGRGRVVWADLSSVCAPLRSRHAVTPRG
ncbi:ATP-binding protein [Streptomyces sp. H27-D2]|nr:ATP-binding protein [Streptomyces sp. H27-D2]